MIPGYEYYARDAFMKKINEKCPEGVNICAAWCGH